MKVLFLVGLLAAVAAAEIRRYDGDKVFRVTPNTAAQWKVVQSLQDGSRDQFDFWGESGYLSGALDIRVGAESVAMFESLMNSAEISTEVLLDDVQQMIDSVERENAEEMRNHNRADGIVGTFPTYDDTMTWLDQMCTQHSTMASCGVVGKSYYNRTIKYIKIGANSSASKKKVWIEGTMHAREWLSTATVVYIIDKLLTQYNSDATVKRMLDDYDWYIIPISNPDGYVYTHETDRLWRKTRSPNPSGNTRCVGVDPNRNFGYKWNSKFHLSCI